MSPKKPSTSSISHTIHIHFRRLSLPKRLEISSYLFKRPSEAIFQTPPQTQQLIYSLNSQVATAEKNSSQTSIATALLLSNATDNCPDSYSIQGTVAGYFHLTSRFFTLPSLYGSPIKVPDKLPNWSEVIKAGKTKMPKKEGES